MNHQAKVILSYEQENFQVCLNLIAESPAAIRYSSHYKILTAICLVNLRLRFEEAHSIIDEVIAKDLNNAFAFYAKGLAFYNQKKLSQAIFCFNKAIELDVSGSMARAKVFKTKATEILVELGIDVDITKGGSDKENDDNGTKGFETEISDASEEKSKSCSVCFKRFAKHFSLRRHMALHTGERPHKCSDCNYAFIQKSDLKRHSATHLDEFNFECPTCDKRFKTQKNLQGHAIAHVTDRPFKCRICPKTFKLNKLRTYHESLHKGAKPFGCDLCGKRFVSKVYLKTHIKTHIEPKPFGCNLCNISFVSIDQLSSHYQTIHGSG